MSILFVQEIKHALAITDYRRDTKGLICSELQIWSAKNQLFRCRLYKAATGTGLCCDGNLKCKNDKNHS
jgi:hypothetical protein